MFSYLWLVCSLGAGKCGFKIEKLIMGSIARLSTLGRLAQQIIKSGKHAPVKYIKVCSLINQEKGNANF